jgi:hypothetical protein
VRNIHQKDGHLLWGPSNKDAIHPRVAWVNATTISIEKKGVALSYDHLREKLLKWVGGREGFKYRIGLIYKKIFNFL